MSRKILIIPSWYPSDSAPLNGIFVHDQALAISKEYDVAVLAVKHVGRRDIAQRAWGKRAEFEVRSGIRIFRERAMVPFQRLQLLLYQSHFRAYERGFQRVLATWGKPYLIHAHVVLPAGFAAVRLGERYSLPVVLTEHSGPFSTHLSTRYQRYLVSRTLRRSSRLIAVSPYLADQIRSFDRALDITVLGNIVKSDFFFPDVQPDQHKSTSDLTFLSVALLTEVKGLTYLLRATLELKERGFHNFQVIIGGGGPIRPRLENEAQELGVSENVRFLGILQPEEVRSWMQKADALILPSLHETFGIVLGEAMACGKPVISTRCGGPEFVVTPENGILVEAANSTALADAMEGFLKGQYTFDPQAVRQSVVSRFGEEAFLGAINKVYEKFS